MEFMEFSGKTVDDAITEALVSLGITSDQVEYEVIEKGGSGFLGFNAKPAKIRARKKVDTPVEEVAEAVSEVKAETTEEAAGSEAKAEEAIGGILGAAAGLAGAASEAVAEVSSEVKAAKEPMDVKAAEAKIKEFLSKVFGAMNMNVEIIVKEAEEKDMLDVELKGDDMGVLIGKRGQTLDALQYLTNLTLNKHSDRYIRVKMDTENYRERRKATLENLAKNLASKAKRTGKDVELEPMNPYERRIIHYALQGDKAVETHSVGEEPYRHVVITLK
jgi:spoIIIJ-associated protein